MTNDIDELNKKIMAARGQDPKSIQAQEQIKLESESKQGIQAGIELVGAIFIPTAIGYCLDQWLHTKPAFMLVLFFLGICTGFYNVYRVTQKLGTAVGNKSSEKDAENGLHDAEKDGKTTPEK